MTASPAPGSQAAAATGAAPAHLLLVDDDESVLLTMQAILEQAGYRVIAAGTLAAALAAVERAASSESAPLDVVVSDLHLDEGDGLQVIAAAKRLNPTTTGIILTGYGTFEAVTRAVRASVDDFLVKPTDVDELKRSIARCAAKAREARALAARAQETEAARRSEAALRESEARFRLLSDAAPVMIWAAGTNMGATFFNRRWLEFTGRTLPQELGFGWAEGVYPDDYERCMTTYRQAYETRTPFSMEFRLRRADGLYRWVEDDGVPYVRPDGGFEGFVGVCADVTDRKQEELEREAQLLRERAARVEAEAEAELARAEADAAVLRSVPPRSGPGTPPVIAPPPLPPSAVKQALPPRPAPRKPPTSAVGLVRKRPHARREPSKPPSSVPPGDV